jgi:hypothetical protein
MRNSPLTLQPKKLVQAYLIAPAFGALAAWFAECLVSGSLLSLRALLLLPWVMVFGYFLIVAAELTLVTPFVWAHRIYRFRWLNGAVACLLAIAVGAMLGFGFASIQVVPNVQTYLSERIAAALVVAAAAASVALTFRIIAYRQAPAEERTP